MSHQLSRRQLLGSLGGLLLAACRSHQSLPSPAPNPEASPTSAIDRRRSDQARRRPAGPPREFPVWIEPGLPASFASRAEAFTVLLAEMLPSGWHSVRIDVPERASVRLRRTADPTGALILAERSFVPVVSHWNLVRGISSEALGRLLNGTILDWQALGSPEPLAVELVSLRNGGLELSGAAYEASDPQWCAQFLMTRPGGLAVVERAELEPEMRALWLDGHDPLSPSADELAGAGLVERLVVEGSDALQDIIQEVAAQLPQQVLEPSFTIAVAGDIILGRTVHRIMERSGDWAAPFRAVAPLLAGADLTVADLECALTSSFAPPDDPFTMRFMTFPQAVEGLLLAGIDAVSLANNHSMDFGAQGMRDTLAILQAHGIAHCGIGETLAEARRPALLDVAGTTIALLGYDGISGAWYGAGEDWPGTAPLTVEYVIEDVSAAAGLADIVIPFFHWGIEYTLLPTEEQRRIARAAIDAGATLVLGSHPHWLQGFEFYRGKPIFYSLGNFVFDQEWSLETKQGVILRLRFSGARLLTFSLEPVMIEDYHRPRPAHDQERVVMLQRIRSSSLELLASASG